MPSPLPCHTQCYYFSPSRFLLPYFNTTTTSVEEALSIFRKKGQPPIRVNLSDRLKKKVDPICPRQKRSRSCSFMFWLSRLDKLTCWRVGAGTSFFMNSFYVPSPLPCHTQCYYFSPSRFLLPYFNTTTTSVEEALSIVRQQGRPPIRVNLSDRLKRKLTPLPAPKALACSCMLWLSRLDKWTCWRVGWAKAKENWSQLGLLAEPTFCFSCKRFAKFCKEV